MRPRNANLNANATTARRSRAYETSRNIMTRHVRHIFTQGDQTKQIIFPSRNQFVNCNISIPSKQNGLLQYNNQEFDCCNIQSHLAQPSCTPWYKRFTICSLKSKETIIFAHNYFKKQNTNQASHCFDFYFSNLLGT